MLLVILLGAWLPNGSLFAQEARATSPTRSDTPAFTVTRPSLLSSIVVTQAEADSDSDTNEALSDYQYYSFRAVPVLERHGIEVHVTNDSTIRWRDSLGVHSVFAADSGGVVYLFVMPNGRKKVLHAGVEVDDAILAAAREQFGISIP